jgi:uncharacterized protein (DUF885 family)
MIRRIVCAALVLAPAALSAQQPVPLHPTDQSSVPSLTAIAERPESELARVVARFEADRSLLHRRYSVEFSEVRRTRMRNFYNEWQRRLKEVDFGKLSQEARLDYILLDARLRSELLQLDRAGRRVAETAVYAPFAATIASLQDSRRGLELVKAPEAARTLALVAQQVDSLKRQLERPTAASQAAVRGEIADTAHARRVLAARSVILIDSSRETLDQWYKFYSGYDPGFSWWVSEPYKRVSEGLKSYAKVLRERVLGEKEGEVPPIVGDPIGSEALAADLALEFIAYSPQELLAIAEREFAWGEAEMKKAAREMGFDNWHDALEKVKSTYVEPGQQPALALKLAREATEYVKKHNLVTVPELAEEMWRMEMLTPEAQRIAPFFLGGEVLQVAFPTADMTYEEKMMTLRGNNPHFSRAVVFHELIPGHGLQQYMSQRYNSHRQAFATPFWTEGWALYWEMLLWDRGFTSSAPDRVGALFWRNHRAARIIFSIRFHLGTMTPQEAIDFLVDRVGHERANAAAEVRRSFSGQYPPLYQLAYMIGGLQFRALHQELVASGRMTDRQFHDAVLQSGRIPVELVRARIAGTPLTRDYRAQWRFAGNLPR